MSMIRFSLVAASAVLLLAACGKAEESETPSPAEPAAKAEAPAAPTGPLGPDQTVTTDGATVSVGAAASKVATPAYAPLYPGAVVVNSVVGESGVGKGGTVTYRANASTAAIIDFYEGKVEAAGKPVTMNAEMGANVRMLTAGDSGDGKGAMQVIASPAGSGSEVQLTWSDEETAARPSSTGPAVGSAGPPAANRDNIPKKRTGG
ncbi:hypothetical protein [Caulobacter sp. NIBR1757]|uniref:hypothetical protein n=1 Tax=Caulobacter sp. NIBR1757 TaxID=3016000 RepID=UPI0022F0D628|nr:hypothetical protein [Caulobacter sp. NIBR1757]WGM41067.1 hypothetical protein AMEJIAPC_04015 [Caulobacter sp. NIBR1757]